jgi:arginyl-tRNA synthetase
VNDRGNQIEKLVSSVFAKIDSRWAADEEELYQGEYIDIIATNLEAQPQDISLIYDVLSGENNTRGLITEINERYRELTGSIVEMMIGMIKTPLEKLNIEFDNWFNESSLVEMKGGGYTSEILNKLKKSGHSFQKDGALMLKADEPRVLIKSDGDFTYFLTDLAYHDLKMKKYDKIINIWGADHHGYVPRMIAGLNALGHNTDKLDIHLIQFANLFRGKEKVSMSTRKGEFVELETLREEIGDDAVNFFYLTKNKDQHLDFDLNIAVTSNKNNPVYYIQYAHARIEKILNETKNYQSHKYDLESLDNELEQNIISTLLDFNEVCEKTIVGLQPHMMTHYLQKLAQDFHSYYANVKILTDEIDYSKIYLIAAIQKILKCGLDLLNINAPKEM